MGHENLFKVVRNLSRFHSINTGDSRYLRLGGISHRVSTPFCNALVILAGLVSLTSTLHLLANLHFANMTTFSHNGIQLDPRKDSCMNQVIKIALGVALGGVTVLLVDRAITAYELQLVIDSLERIEIPAAKAPAPAKIVTRRILPKPAEVCRAQSNGTYDEAYLDCRYGLELTVRVNPSTGKSQILKRERINRIPNVL